MLSRRLICALTLALLTPLVGAVPAAAEEGTELENQIESVIFAEHNEARAAAGLPPLTLLDDIDPIAEAHTRAMAASGGLYHSNISRLIDEFPNHWWAGENVLVTFGAGGTATRLWLDSPGHRANLLATKATHMTVAVHCGGDGRLWATVQLVENRQAPTATPTFTPSDQARQLTCSDTPLPSSGTNPWAPFSSADEFVVQQYEDFLGRAPDATGRGYWTTVLERGEASPTALVEMFLASEEFGLRVKAVNRLYLATFGRDPNAAELDYWAAQMGAGASIEWIADYFAESPEFVSRYGDLGAAGYVDRLYQNVLGRPSDAGGRDFWVGQMAQGHSRGDVLRQFAESAEFRQEHDPAILVRAIYLGLLERSPDDAGLDYWTGLVRRGVPVSGLITGFLDSGEYASRVG